MHHSHLLTALAVIAVVGEMSHQRLQDLTLASRGLAGVHAAIVRASWVV